MNKIEEEMITEQDSLVITDPCYIIKDEHWEHFCDLHNITISEYLRKYHNFGEVIGGDTGYGDWSNEVKDSNGETIGEFCADSGMFVVVTMSDLLNYNPNTNSLQYKIDKGLATVVPDFTGRVIYSYEGDREWAFIEGISEDGNNFNTLHLM